MKALSQNESASWGGLRHDTPTSQNGTPPGFGGICATLSGPSPRKAGTN